MYPETKHPTYFRGIGLPLEDELLTELAKFGFKGRNAHHAGLAVHPWTVRPENSFLPVEYQQGNPSSPNFPRAEGNASALLAELYKLGVDGIFADDSALAVSTRHRVFG